MEEDQTEPTLTPREQLQQSLHFLLHNHYALGGVAAVVVIIALFVLFKHLSRGNIRALERRAQEGDAAAAAEVGELYHYGEEGAPLSVKKAAKWYRVAAQAGHAGGMNGLGTLARDGDGMQQNHNEAAKYFEAAAKLGHPMGQANLALLYFHGNGMPQNPQRAYFWALLARANPKSSEIQKRTESFNRFFKEVHASLSPTQRQAPEARAKDWQPGQGESREQA